MNIITQLFAFIAFAITVNMLPIALLSMILITIIFFLVTLKNHSFYTMLRRLKWVYLLIMLIYAFNTPGEHLQGWYADISPTYEGLQSGFVQLARITTMLAAISYILSSNSKQQLISGFYFLLYPLSKLGLNVERFAVRLWLTLHYVDSQPPIAKRTDFFNQLTQHLSMIFSESQFETMHIELERPVFTRFDYVFIVMMFVLLILLSFKAVG